MVGELVKGGRSRARELARQAAHRGVRWTARRLGYEVLWPSYYNGIPRFDELPAEFWSRRGGMPAVALAEEASMRYLEDELGEHLAEFAPAATGDAGDYFVPNGSYDEVDGALLWAMLRRHRPRRVLELGSGYSSLLIRDALDANASDGLRAQHVVVDPFPRPIVLGPSNACRRYTRFRCCAQACSCRCKEDVASRERLELRRREVASRNPPQIERRP